MGGGKSVIVTVDMEIVYLLFLNQYIYMSHEALLPSNNYPPPLANCQFYDDICIPMEIWLY